MTVVSANGNYHERPYIFAIHGIRENSIRVSTTSIDVDDLRDHRIAALVVLNEEFVRDRGQCRAVLSDRPVVVTEEALLGLEVALGRSLAVTCLSYVNPPSVLETIVGAAILLTRLGSVSMR